jgi:16S rRNA A1518/A1519 N6-dimethyltransferase RsmA/KsgA/DIM1 with predicted DNA glycosylase/AP lyase activity
MAAVLVTAVQSEMVARMAAMEVQARMGAMEVQARMTAKAG